MFGLNKRFTVNSIIVRPDEAACLAAQDAEGSKAHYGRKYQELSVATGGGIGSICDGDYSGQLKYFKNQIIKDMASLPLECTPVEGSLKVNIEPAFTSNYRVEQTNLVFNPKIPAGHKIKAEYQCLGDLPVSISAKANYAQVMPLKKASQLRNPLKTTAVPKSSVRPASNRLPASAQEAKIGGIQRAQKQIEKKK